jgi:peptidoglycan L-alanyl-D-glutamate endopeptidase CwlK
MDTLREGARGDDVRSLQSALQQKGFNPGATDGIFGAGTEAAVLAFQQSEGLEADGIVGPKTAAALGFAAAELPPAPSGMPNVTVAIASKMAPGAPLDNIKNNLSLVLQELEAAGLISRSIVLAAIATIVVETGRFAPISEFISRFNTSPGGQPFDLYDFRRDLGNGAVGDGARYKGRGFVQLTGKANYQRFGQQIGVDLIPDPEQANEPSTAAKLLAAFLKAQQHRIEQALAVGDFATARRTVNGGTFGLDQFTTSYQTGRRLLDLTT